MNTLEIALDVQKLLETNYTISCDDKGTLNISCYSLEVSDKLVRSAEYIRCPDEYKKSIDVYKVFMDGTKVESQNFRTWTGAIQWVFLQLVKWDTGKKINNFFRKQNY